MREGRVVLCAMMGLSVAVAAVSIGRADAFNAYHLTGSFNLPALSPFDVLGDGRLVTLVGADVYAETAVGSHAFSSAGTLAGMDVPGYAAAFVRVSPDGTRIAVGNGGGASYGNYQVGVFALANLSGSWFPVSHYDAEWIDNTHVALTAGAFGAPGVVTVLDSTSDPAQPTNPAVVANIGGASAGITFDALGNLYTGNSFVGDGPSQTGWIMAFSPATWQAALAGGAPADFEASGTLVADLLSAASLGFDANGNLHVGGGDFLGGEDVDYSALVRQSALASALAGNGPVNPNDPTQVRRLDPDTANPYDYYDLNFNAVTGELYVRNGSTVYTYAVPEPHTLLLLLIGGVASSRAIRRKGGCDAA